MRYILFLWGDLWFCTYNWHIWGHNCAVGGIWIWIKDFLCFMCVFPLKHTGNILQITKSHENRHFFVEIFCLWVWLSLSVRGRDGREVLFVPFRIAHIAGSACTVPLHQRHVLRAAFMSEPRKRVIDGSRTSRAGCDKTWLLKFCLLNICVYI